MGPWLTLAKQGKLGRPLAWEHGDMVFQGGTTAAHTYLLTAGVMEVVHFLDDGRSLTVKLLVAPTFFGSIEAFSGEATYLESARALGGCQGYRLATDEVRRLSGEDPALANVLLFDTCEAFCQSARGEPGRVYDTETELANVLSAYLELFGQDTDAGRRLALRRTQGDLANAIGTSERQVQRILTAWRKQGWFDKLEGEYHIREPATLDALAGPLRGSLVHRYRGP